GSEWEVVTTQGLNGAAIGSKWVDITEFPELDTTEVWTFVNRSGVTHPMHMHLIFFQVLDRQAFEDQGGLVVPIGSPVPPPAHEAGWKDTVQVGPNEILRVIARFDDYTGKYAYHCHILEHEDHEMMRQFQTVDCGNLVLEPGEECDDGNEASGDRCSATCEAEDFLILGGTAEGGSVDLTVDGEVIMVTTTPGQTAAQVAAALADAINNNANLAAAGVTAVSTGNTLFTTGVITNVNINDAGLQEQMIPALSPRGVLAFAAILGLFTAAGLLRRRSAARARHPGHAKGSKNL
ncbi:MAG: multicopper oxidase domain-containing protein, partial [Deltaproteobacteria bacterium]|nr:multicopper oxidase domain-containing protein [Deltaproteobacteria bacterium]